MVAGAFLTIVDERLPLGREKPLGFGIELGDAAQPRAVGSQTRAGPDRVPPSPSIVEQQFLIGGGELIRSP